MNFLNHNIKLSSHGPINNFVEPETVCQTIYETQCDSTRVDLQGTQCRQVKRKICAEDNCNFIEGEEEVNMLVQTDVNLSLKCKDVTVENTIESPEEMCTMEPQKECKNVTTR